MEKGLLILLGTFVVVGVIHFFSLKTMKISESTKTVYRKFFWYFYGGVFMISSAVNLFQGGALDWVFTLQFFTGLVIVILHLLGKIET
jgi:hypothetical protein